MKMHNFNSGPAILPAEVLVEAARAVIDFNNSGLSILEISHRGNLFQPVLDEAIALVKELMQLDEAHEVLFLHGGASTQFMQVPMNLLPAGGKAAFVDTGVWSSKAIKEARLFGEAVVLASSKEQQYNHIPKEFTVPQDAAYLHITTNNTIYGTQWQEIPESGIPLVADMSSDILSRELDFNRFGLIYAGAQKNTGAAGVNLLIVNREILGKAARDIPTMLDYRNHIEAGSLINTPPVFAIYVSMLTLRWLKKMGGLAAIEVLNNEKAALLYNTLDALPLFKPTVVKEDRSKMNVCFVMDNPDLEAAFLNLCKQENMYGIKGYRTVGGFRASLYNALPLSSVQALTSAMQYFAEKHG
jgi:phosphoserine aminotransferase